MSGRRSFFLLIFALGFGVPSSAQAACGVPSARAVYETPEVQVYERAKNRRVRDVIACLRATGKARKVDVRANDGMGTDEFSTVNEVLGGRWIWTSLLGSAAESADTREERLTDLRTGATFSIVTEDEFNSRAALAVRGALVVAGEGGVIAHFTDGHKVTLAMAPSTGLAVRGARVYWREQGVARTATLTLPAADPARARPLVRTISRCKPRRGARLALRTEALVLSRSGGAVWACRPTRGRNFRLGAVANLRPLSDRHVAYAKPGLIGVFDAVRGNFHELEGTSAAATASALLASGPGGLRAWTASRTAATVLTADPASEVALGDGVAYWLDAAGNPQTADI
jgi:hypothetical protein